MIALLNREIIRAMTLPDMKEKMAALGFTVVGSTPVKSATLFHSESAKWSKVIRYSAIKTN